MTLLGTVPRRRGDAALAFPLHRAWRIRSAGYAPFKEEEMTKAKRQDRWLQLRGAARTRWDRLTEQDVDAVHGNIERLIDALRARYGYGRDVAVREITTWSRMLRATPQA